MALLTVEINSEHVVGSTHWRPALLPGDATYPNYLSCTMELPFADEVVSRVHMRGIAAAIAEAAATMAVGIAIHKVG